jgi:hypothetical protein
MIASIFFITLIPTTGALDDGISRRPVLHSSDDHHAPRDMRRPLRQSITVPIGESLHPAFGDATIFVHIA